MQNLGVEISSAQYESEFSSWKFAEQTGIKAKEEEISGLFRKIHELSILKRARLNDDLAREIYVEQTRVLVDQHKSKYDKVLLWISNEINYATLRPTVIRNYKENFYFDVPTIDDAKANMGIFQAHEDSLTKYEEYGVEAL
eukprot:UC4_evm1s705